MEVESEKGIGSKFTFTINGSPPENDIYEESKVQSEILLTDEIQRESFLTMR